MSLFTFGQNFGNVLSNSVSNSITNENGSANQDTGDIIEIDDNEEDNREDDDSFTELRAKIPRLNSDSNIKDSVSNKENEESESIEEETCSICLEPWTNSGAHRLVCLKCGHLFGEACIERWLKTVPKCNSFLLLRLKKYLMMILK